MKALLIDVEAKQLREVELKATESGRAQTDEMHKLIGCEMFEHVKLSDKLSLWVDEEGLLKDRTKGFLLCTSRQPIMGNGLLTGMDASGEITDVPCHCTPDRIEIAISFIDYDDPKKVPVPPIEVYSIGEDGHATKVH